MWTPLIGASNAGGVGRNRDSEPISGFTALLVRRHCIDNTCPAATGQVLSIRRRRTTIRPQVVTIIAGSKWQCWWQERRRNVYDKKPQRYVEDNRTAHWIAHNDKSVAYVTNNKRLRRFVLLKLTTDRHKASRSLFATAELLVKKLGKMTIADKVMNPQHFRRDLADICIWINPDSNPRSIFVEILALAEVFALWAQSC